MSSIVKIAVMQYWGEDFRIGVEAGLDEARDWKQDADCGAAQKRSVLSFVFSQSFIIDSGYHRELLHNSCLCFSPLHALSIASCIPLH